MIEILVTGKLRNRHWSYKLLEIEIVNYYYVINTIIRM